jgi:hypothetical protein
MILSNSRKKPNLSSYVVCSGIVYGNGEDALYDILEVTHVDETAYQGENPLNIIGDGRNNIPMIHAADLSSIVKYLVYESPKDMEYIIATDHSPQRSQNRLIKCISEGMGGSEIKQLSYLDGVFCDDYNILTLNVNLVPTEVLEEKPAAARKPGLKDGRQGLTSARVPLEVEGRFRREFRRALQRVQALPQPQDHPPRRLRGRRHREQSLRRTVGLTRLPRLAKKLRIPYVAYEKLIAEVSQKVC